MKAGIYQKITDQIVAELEKGVRPWLHGTSSMRLLASCAPLRGNGILQRHKCNHAVVGGDGKGYAAPIWMTFKQASELEASGHSSVVVYADHIIRTETDAKTGEDSERAIPFLKGYKVFNVEQIEGLPECLIRITFYGIYSDIIRRLGTRLCRNMWWVKPACACQPTCSAEQTNMIEAAMRYRTHEKHGIQFLYCSKGFARRFVLSNCKWRQVVFHHGPKPRQRGVIAAAGWSSSAIE